MRTSSQTLISVIRQSIQDWRKSKAWSREAVTQEIVNTFENLSGPVHTNIRFDPHTTDTYERMRVNADRFFRWLDDETKDSTLLPANLIPYILAALPKTACLNLVNQILQPLGIVAHSIIETGELDAFEVHHLQLLIKENAEAVSAYAALTDGATFEELVIAQREITESIQVSQRLLASVESSLVNA